MQDDPTHVLAADLRALLVKFRRRLREETGSEAFSAAQLSVLRRLERDGPATLSSLARAEAMRPQSMASLVAPLEAAGMLRGDRDPDDRRQTLLSVTEICRDWLRRKRAAKEDWLAGRIRVRLSASEQARLAEAVETLKRLIED